MSKGKILSIQSHVVSGYVGNRSCVLPMQILGNDVDFINSVQFSNHTGYEVIKGQVLTAADLRNLYDGLVANGLDNYTQIMTGYIGAASFLEEVVHIVKEQKSKNPSLVYLCDPVMGDSGQLYTPPELLSIYIDRVLPITDIIMPNQFEAELLTGMTITNEAEVLRAIDWLHGRGIKVVVITSTNLDSEGRVLLAYASKLGDNNHAGQKFRMRIPRMPVEFVGTGDLFAGLFMAWMRACPDHLKLVCSRVIATMQVILQRTLENSVTETTDGSRSNKNVSFAQRELRIVDCVKEILNPTYFEDIDTL